MATHEKPPVEVDNCRCLLRGAVKNLADRLYGPPGPAWGTPVRRLEAVAASLGQALQEQLLSRLLLRQAAAFHAAPLRTRATAPPAAAIPWPKTPSRACCTPPPVTPCGPNHFPRRQDHVAHRHGVKRLPASCLVVAATQQAVAHDMQL